MEPIRCLNSKRLVEYLKPGMKVLLKFDWHGMGDCIMFLPSYEKLKQLYPDVSFNLKCAEGQELFEDLHDTEYDLVVDIVFPDTFMRVAGRTWDRSKAETCCQLELGIPFTSDMDFTWRPKRIIDSGIDVPVNTIGVGFQSNSGPRKNASVEVAKKVWNTIKDCGYTPMEVQFIHPQHRGGNGPYPFVDRTCRNCKATVDNAIDVISKCCGFIGVNTGTFVMAAAMKDRKVLFMRTRESFYPLYSRYKEVPELDCSSPNTVSEELIQKYLCETIV